MSVLIVLPSELDSAQLERKIRLLTLATLGFQNMGRDVPYSVIASVLQVEPSQVESWVIDGMCPPLQLTVLGWLLTAIPVIRAGLLSGKLSQTAQTLHVTRATARAFEREQWEVLEKRLQAWKAGLASVLEVVSASRKKAGGDAPTNVTPAVPTPAGAETPAAAQAVAA